MLFKLDAFSMKRPANSIIFTYIYQELVERKANVYATLEKLQDEVKQITAITEILKDADNIKDSKTFVEEIKKKFGVSYLQYWWYSMQ